MVEKGESSGTVEVVMDTPERSKTQITAPVAKYEESPVFNYLNNLSPIKPIKSVHSTQTFNPLSFASIPSIFTSPHVTSLKESRFLRRHQLGDPSKPEFASDNVSKDDTSEAIVELAHASGDHEDSFNPGSSEPSYNCQQLADEFVQSLTYDCSSPDLSRTPNHGLKTALMPNIQEESCRGFLGTGANMEAVSETDQNKEAAGCDWESLISDAGDLLVFDSPNDAEAFKRSTDPGTSYYTSVTNDGHSIQDLVAVGSGEQLREGSELENQFTQPGEGNELKEFSEAHDVNGSSSLDVDCMAGDPADSVDPENVCNLYRGMRRRCLVFELSGGRRKHLHENSSSDCAMLPPQSDGNIISSDKQLVPAKSSSESSSRCVLPGIGLHLNALATTSKDYKVVKNEALSSGRQLLIASSSATNFHSSNTVQESLSKPLDNTNLEREIVPVETEASGYLVNEEFNQNSPKKKRQRLENGEGETSCKRCNCKKSKCLKLYCECFAAGVYCVEPCSCLDCFNKPIHEDTVLATRKQIESRNPLAFAPKVIRSSDQRVTEIGDDSSKTPASARHKRGCNCKKSGCLKKYCECYQGGVGCSINCRCEGCKNAFGRKDGSGLIGSEVELEEEEIDLSQKSVMDGNHPRAVIQCDGEQNPDYAPPATPLPFGGPLMQLPFASKNKPPRSSHLSVGGSGSGLYNSKGFGKSNFFLSQPKFDKPFGTIQDDEMPEMLQMNRSPISGVKSTSSPNSKRVSPPHCGPGTSSPGQRSSRKLILQSIPSFPSLTPRH